MSDSSWPHELQHARPPCPSPSPGVHSNSCPWSRWCHPAISSSVIPFSSCPQSLPASESFPMSQLFAWGSQSTGVSTLASFLPKNTQGWSPLEWTGWSPCSPRDYQEYSPTPNRASLKSRLTLKYRHDWIQTFIVEVQILDYGWCPSERLCPQGQPGPPTWSPQHQCKAGLSQVSHHYWGQNSA